MLGDYCLVVNGFLSCGLLLWSLCVLVYCLLLISILVLISFCIPIFCFYLLFYWLKIGSWKLYFVLLMKSHLQSYPCPLQINYFWNLGFFLGITIIIQIITGIFLGLHYTSDLNSAYSSLFFFIREIYYGWSLRYLHSYNNRKGKRLIRCETEDKA